MNKKKAAAVFVAVLTSGVVTQGFAQGQVAKSQASGKESYDSNPVRKAKALAISRAGTDTPVLPR